MNQQKAHVFQQLCDHVKQTALFESINGLLNWDERTYLPERAGEYRAEQIATLATMIHQRRTDPRLGEWLIELADEAASEPPHGDVATVIRQVRREFEKQTRLPPKLVEELARCSVVGQQVWVAARKADDFQMFAPHLEKIVDLKRQQAEAVGYEDVPYDALLDDYEPMAKTADVRETLGQLRAELVPLVQAIAESGRQAPVALLQGFFPAALQADFGKAAAAALGFDFTRGRLDVTDHPFCTELGPHDCRITTRYDETCLTSAFFGTLHEAGHGMYDQGRRPEAYGLPTGQYVSLGIHESQSRMWENQVGRSRAFWSFFLPQAKQIFQPALSDVDPDCFYFAINDVRPSLIRVEADEATYNLHIIIRFELEQALISNELQVADLPRAWNEKYQEYLGIQPPNAAQGVLQDIHWSAALFGYFPTYSLGNLYAAQLFEHADRQLGGLQPLLAAGDFRPLLQWLQQHVHRWGQCYTPAELIQNVTGQPLSHDALMRHLRGKLAPLYGLA